MGRLSWIIQAQYNHIGSLKWEMFSHYGERKYVKMEEWSEMWHWKLWKRDKAKECSGPEKLKKAGKWIIS